MQISDGQLIDLLRGELEPREEAVVREALEADSALRSRFDQLTRTLALTRSLPTLAPSAAFHDSVAHNVSGQALTPDSPLFGALVDELCGELSGDDARRLREIADRHPDLVEKRRELEQLLKTFQSVKLDDKAVRKAISDRLRTILSSDSDEAGDADIALIVDAMRREAVNEDSFNERLRSDAAFARKARIIERIFRAVRQLAIEPSAALKISSIPSRAEADALAEPPAFIRELIDYARGELSTAEGEALSARLSSDAALGANLMEIRRVLGAARSLPAIEPSRALRERISLRIAGLVRESETRRWKHSVGEAVDMLRGEMPPERAEATLEQKGDVALEVSRVLRAASAIPSIEPGKSFKERIAQALDREAKKTTEAKKTPKSVPPRKTPEVAAPKLPSHRVNMRLLRGGAASIVTLFRSRHLIAALLFHMIALAATFFIMIGRSPAGADVRSLALDLTGDVILMHGDYGRAPSLVERYGAIAPGKGQDAGAGIDELPPAPVQESVLGLGHGMEEVFVPRTLLPEQAPEPRATLDHWTGAGVALTKTDGAAYDEDGWFGSRYVARRVKQELVERTIEGSGAELMARLDEILAYIARAQLDDGSWLWESGMAKETRSSIENGQLRESEADREMRRMENTALSLLALLGDGNTLERGAYKANVRRGVDFVLSRQHPASGGFTTVDKGGRKDWFNRPYSDALCTLVMAEVCAGGGRSAERDALKRGLERLIKLQIREGYELSIGGFPYEIPSGQKSPEADIATTAWVAQALRTAEAGGWRHESLERVLEGIERYLTRNSAGQSSAVYSSPWVASHISASVSAPAEAGVSAAMVTEMLCLDTEVFAEELESQTQFLNQDRYLPSNDNYGAFGIGTPRTNYLAWYFASLAMMQNGVESEEEKTYLKTLYETMFLTGNYLGGTDEEGNERYRDPNRGSFSPQGIQEELHGRVYAAALGALCIQNAYRVRFPDSKRSAR